MTDLRKAAEMALEALEGLVKYDNHGMAYAEQDAEGLSSIAALRQALAQPEPEPMSYVPGFYRGEKISLSRIKLGERFVLVRTGQIYSKTKHGYWNEEEQRSARLHLICQVQLIKEKNT